MMIKYSRLTRFHSLCSFVLHRDYKLQKNASLNLQQSTIFSLLMLIRSIFVITVHVFDLY